MPETYKTICSPTENILFKEKASKFIGYAFPITDEQEVKSILENLKKEHHKARHVCYAYRLGKNGETYRANDDGEPNNTAGIPILGQLKSFELTNLVLLVVRYFGGTKLGVGGLIQAYKTSAKQTLEACEIIEQEITEQLNIQFDYTNMNKVMKLIHEYKIIIQKQNLDNNCEMIIAVKPSVSSKIILDLENMCTDIKTIN